MLARHPAIRLELVGASFERTIQLLRTGAVDVAVGFEDAFSEWSEVKREAIGSLLATLFVRKDHPILQLDAPSHTDLARLDFVVPSDSRPYGSIIRGISYDAGVFLWQRHVHLTDNFPVVKGIVASSDAIGVTTLDYAKSDSFAASYARVPGESPFPQPPCVASSGHAGSRLRRCERSCAR